MSRRGTSGNGQRAVLRAHRRTTGVDARATLADAIRTEPRHDDADYQGLNEAAAEAGADLAEALVAHVIAGQDFGPWQPANDDTDLGPVIAGRVWPSSDFADDSLSSAVTEAMGMAAAVAAARVLLAATAASDATDTDDTGDDTTGQPTTEPAADPPPPRQARDVTTLLAAPAAPPTAAQAA